MIYATAVFALVIGMYYAIVQELVILYIEVSDWDRPPRNGHRKATTMA